ncbi:MAG: flavin-containing monooxygenase [Acidimicrobiia bacterium]
MGEAADVIETDVLVVGAGVSGLYAAYRLRGLGLVVEGVEAGEGVGGTWYWNRYPGCRCDVPTIEYSYSWDEELEQEWSFPETMSAQPDIERYLNHVADRHDLRRHFRFGTRVTSATYDDTRARWLVDTDGGPRFDARWLVMATGALSAPNLPDIPGIDSFAATIVHTGTWPRDGVDLDGMRVAIIGTGSSAMQAIPHLARAAAHLTVFQRTPNYAFPAQVTATDPDFESYVKEHYRELRALQRSSRVGISGFERPAEDGRPARTVGFGALGGGEGGGGAAPFDLADPELNRRMRDFFADMVRSRVTDPAIADALIPTDYPFGCKRIVIEIDYFETFNRADVTLVDLRRGGITEITPTSVRTEQGDFEIDVLVLATGFDALTGPLTRIEVVGRGGRRLRDDWADGPSAYLGLVAAGYPNLFLITGPGSPSVLSNMIVSIEQHVDFVADAIAHLGARDLAAIDADPSAQAEWMLHVHDVALGTQYTDPTCNSWYLGSNIDGKVRTILPYTGGCDRYRETCDEVAADGYRGFVLS